MEARAWFVPVLDAIDESSGMAFERRSVQPYDGIVAQSRHEIWLKPSLP